MNRLFVNIKVDREERPDLDQIYQAAHHLITRRSGGWPLTMFLTPEGTPFFGGTYFPKSRATACRGSTTCWHASPRCGPGSARGSWRKATSSFTPWLRADRRRADDGAGRAGDRTDALRTTAARAASGLRDALMPAFDPVDGGFGGAPKFPHARGSRCAAAARRGRARRYNARCRAADLAAHGRRRTVRPPGRGILPLQHRRSMDDSALREDAVRQRAAAAPVAAAWQLTHEPLLAPGVRGTRPPG